MSVTSKERLVSKLENSKTYREAYVREHIKTSVPLQIRHLREERALTQAQLAALAKTTQTVVSRLEDPNYGNLTLNSLLKIAAALDIALLVKFVPFSRILLEFQDLSPTALSAKSFVDELSLIKAWAEDVKPETSVSSSSEQGATVNARNQGKEKPYVEQGISAVFARPQHPPPPPFWTPCGESLLGKKERIIQGTSVQSNAGPRIANA